MLVMWSFLFHSLGLLSLGLLFLALLLDHPLPVAFGCKDILRVHRRWLLIVPWRRVTRLLLLLCCCLYLELCIALIRCCVFGRSLQLLLRFLRFLRWGFLGKCLIQWVCFCFYCRFILKFFRVKIQLSLSVLLFFAFLDGVPPLNNWLRNLGLFLFWVWFFKLA